MPPGSIPRGPFNIQVRNSLAQCFVAELIDQCLYVGFAPCSALFRYFHWPGEFTALNLAVEGGLGDGYQSGNDLVQANETGIFEGDVC